MNDGWVMDCFLFGFGKEIFVVVILPRQPKQVWASVPSIGNHKPIILKNMVENVLVPVTQSIRIVFGEYFAFPQQI